MTGFQIDPTLFPQVAAKLDEQRQALAAHAAVVNSYASGQGGPWGGDKQGSAFAGIYADVLQHVSEVMSSHADLLNYAGSELRSWADDVVATDDQVATKLNGLGA